MGKATDGRRNNGRTPRGLTPAARFWVKVRGIDWAECWVWTAGLNGGYGAFAVDGKNVYAHRWAYEALVSEIPPGLELDHLCRNRACVNPWHLEPVTPLVNNLRGQGNPSKTHCPQGHAYDDANTRITVMNRRQCIACVNDRNHARRTTTW